MSHYYPPGIPVLQGREDVKSGMKKQSQATTGKASALRVKNRGVTGFSGARMSEARRTADLTQKELAEMVGLGRWCILQLESNTGKAPRAENFKKIADALGVKPLTLLDIQGHPSLLQLRFAAGLSQREAVEIIGGSDRKYSILERGVQATLPSKEIISGIASAFAVSAKAIREALLKSQTERRPS